jgi:hypothetical protein
MEDPMRRRPMLAALLLVSACLARAHGADQPTAEQVQSAGDRLRATVEQYERLLRELGLDSLPSNLRGYASVTEKLARLGERMERLSRDIVSAEALTPDDFARLAADVTGLADDLDRLRREAFPLRVWGHFNAHDHPQPAWGLGFADPLTVVPREKDACPADVATTVELTGARGEAESVQVVVVSLGKDLRGVRTSCRGLRGPGSIIPPAAVEVRPVGYLRLDRTGQQADRTGWWPEALLPDGPVDVPRDTVQPLWLTISIPADAKPGAYAGELYVKPADQDAIRVDLRLRVWAFALPPQPSLRCAVALDPTALARWYHGASDPTAGDVPALLRRHAELLRAYRCLPCREGQGSLLPEDPQPWAQLLPEAGNKPLALPPGQPPARQRSLVWELGLAKAPGLWYGLGNDWAGNYRGGGTSAGLDPRTWRIGEAAPLVYPGPAGQPLPSLRLATLRDGLEDYEYLRLAEQRAPDTPRASELLAAARRLAAGPEGPAPQALLDLRRKLGDLLSEAEKP